MIDIEARLVSIQLVSPASGDKKNPTSSLRRKPWVSIQLVSPASGDSYFIL